MKKFLLIASLFLCSLLLPLQIAAQAGKLPPFRMMQAGNRIFKAEDLPIGKPVIIVYFSTDCEECSTFVKGMLDRMNDFRSVSIAMVTFQSVESVSKYIVKNGLNNYPNLYVGTEGNVFYLRNYYKIMTFPFVALYTKNGDYVITYTSKEVSLDDLVKRVKGL
jgi:hypothetical protein